MTSWVDPSGLVKVVLWYRGSTTGAQSGRVSGSPCTARVEKPRRRFSGPPRSRERQREGPSGGTCREPPRDELVEQGGRRLGRPQHVERAVPPLDQRRQAVARKHGLDRLQVAVRDPREHQHRGPVPQQLRHDLVGARVVDAAHPREVDPGHRQGVGDAGQGALDVRAHEAARGPRDEVCEHARARFLERRVHVDLLDHRWLDPCSGIMMSTWAPGNAGRPSFKGTSSSHGGTMAMRAVPLRMAILPSQRTRYRRIPASPWPRPGSRNRLTPWISAASSAAASPQRSPKRLLCVGSSEWRNPTPASATAITTTRFASLRRQWYACTATQPPMPACSTIF